MTWDIDAFRRRVNVGKELRAKIKKERFTFKEISKQMGGSYNRLLWKLNGSSQVSLPMEYKVRKAILELELERVKKTLFDLECSGQYWP